MLGSKIFTFGPRSGWVGLAGCGGAASVIDAKLLTLIMSPISSSTRTLTLVVRVGRGSGRQSLRRGGRLPSYNHMRAPLQKTITFTTSCGRLIQPHPLLHLKLPTDRKTDTKIDICYENAT